MAQEFHAAKSFPSESRAGPLKLWGKDPVRGSGTNPFNGR